MFRTRRRFFRKGPLPFRYVFIISFIVFIFTTVQGLWIVNKGIEPSLISIAETKTRQVAAQAINDAISKKIADGIDVENLIIVHSNESEKVPGYSFNSKVYNRLISEATERVQTYLNYVEAGDLDKLETFKNDIDIDYEDTIKQKGIVYSIPLGMATNNVLLSNFGPRIPVRFEMIGDVISNIDTKVKETGINNTYLEVYINIKVEMNVIIPFSTKNTEVSNSVKIGDLFIQGDVPYYYNGDNGNGGDPSIVLPKPN
ncbi:sporulation protein YunB [Alkalihalobacillus macyae]|uniref:sporulation protein YunB n=1 Tax=Guptibacillus hwajinpoensis TaxID=208199 RepID=UPI00273C56E6|nr:sporulation protein YunB [Alkalihalobacillus macyae]MDP4552414.1 sporulation protein YunB [Alkalihalobacillus macyae]